MIYIEPCLYCLGLVIISENQVLTACIAYTFDLGRIENNMISSTAANARASA